MAHQHFLNGELVRGPNSPTPTRGVLFSGTMESLQGLPVRKAPPGRTSKVYPCGKPSPGKQAKVSAGARGSKKMYECPMVRCHLEQHRSYKYITARGEREGNQSYGAEAIQGNKTCPRWSDFKGSRITTGSGYAMLCYIWSQTADWRT